MSSLEKISEELQELGYKPRVVPLNGFTPSELVEIDYQPACGRYKGQLFKVGIGFQENAYPEYPPHFVGVVNLSDPSIPVHSSHHRENDEWSMFSVPPSDFWDRLPSSDKNMKTYIHRHLARFWSQL